jgi:hypothetical protein
MLAVVLHGNNPDALSSTLITAGFSIPASSEAHYPSLPAVAQPAPPPPPDPVATTPDPPPPAKVAAVQTVPTRTGSHYGWLDVAGAAGVVGGIGVWTRKWVRRRPVSPR